MVMSKFSSRIANQVVIENEKSDIHTYKVNMKMAIYLCKKFYRANKENGKRLMRDIAKYTEPVHPNRKDERNIKAKSFVGFTYRISA